MVIRFATTGLTLITPSFFPRMYSYEWEKASCISVLFVS